MRNPIIITGGAQRLGLAMAKCLAADGREVLITYRTLRDDLTELHDIGIQTLQADFATDSGVRDFIDSIRGRFSQLRAIVHNASDWAAEDDNTDCAGLFTRMMQVHASAPYQINMALADLLSQAGKVNDIIHMTDYIQDKGSKKHIAYAASKAALHNLTLSFAAKFAPNIKVNSIAPALVMFNQDDSQEYKDKALKKSLLEVCPGAQEAVKAMFYLLESSYITGRTIHIDGGRHLK